MYCHGPLEKKILGPEDKYNQNLFHFHFQTIVNVQYEYIEQGLSITNCQYKVKT